MSLTTALAIAVRAALDATRKPFAVDRADVQRVVGRVGRLPPGAVRPRHLRGNFPATLARAVLTGDLSAVPARLRRHLRPTAAERLGLDLRFAVMWAVAPSVRLVARTTGLDPDAVFHRAARLRRAGWKLARRPGLAADPG